MKFVNSLVPTVLFGLGLIGCVPAQGLEDDSAVTFELLDDSGHFDKADADTDSAGLPDFFRCVEGLLQDESKHQAFPETPSNGKLFRVVFSGVISGTLYMTSTTLENESGLWIYGQDRMTFWPLSKLNRTVETIGDMEISRYHFSIRYDTNHDGQKDETDASYYLTFNTSPSSPSIRAAEKPEAGIEYPRLRDEIMGRQEMWTPNETDEWTWATGLSALKQRTAQAIQYQAQSYLETHLRDIRNSALREVSGSEENEAHNGLYTLRTKAELLERLDTCQNIDSKMLQLFITAERRVLEQLPEF